jgi:hypothetical protein
MRQYVFEIPLCRILNIRPETARRYRALKVLVPDAQTPDGRPLYLSDPASVERHREAIRQYRTRVSGARRNITSLNQLVPSLKRKALPFYVASST